MRLCSRWSNSLIQPILTLTGSQPLSSEEASIGDQSEYSKHKSMIKRPQIPILPEIDNIISAIERSQAGSWQLLKWPEQFLSTRGLHMGDDIKLWVCFPYKNNDSYISRHFSVNWTAHSIFWARNSAVPLLINFPLIFYVWKHFRSVSSTSTVKWPNWNSEGFAQKMDNSHRWIPYGYWDNQLNQDPVQRAAREKRWTGNKWTPSIENKNAKVQHSRSNRLPTSHDLVKNLQALDNTPITRNTRNTPLPVCHLLIHGRTTTTSRAKKELNMTYWVWLFQLKLRQSLHPAARLPICKEPSDQRTTALMLAIVNIMLRWTFHTRHWSLLIDIWRSVLRRMVLFFGRSKSICGGHRSSGYACNLQEEVCNAAWEVLSFGRTFDFVVEVLCSIACWIWLERSAHY